MIHTRFFIIILIILGGIASCQDQPDNLSIKENHANIKSRSLAISKDEAIDLVKQKVLSKDTSDINVFISNTIIGFVEYTFVPKTSQRNALNLQ